MRKSYPEATVFHSEARSLVSSAAGQEFRIPVWLPPSYAESDRSYPVLYILDANVFFGLATDAVTCLILGQEIPEIIVVGIQYPIRSLDEWGTARERDLTPTALDRCPGSGGADRFLTFLQSELIAFVEANYRVDATDRALWGYSLGGLFVLYTLFSQSRLFRRYAAGSPEISWDRQVLLKIEADFAAQQQGLSAELVMSVGALETEFAARLRDMDAILAKRNYAGLHYATLVFEGETHFSGPGPALARGLKSIFAPERAK